MAPAIHHCLLFSSFTWTLQIKWFAFLSHSFISFHLYLIWTKCGLVQEEGWASEKHGDGTESAKNVDGWISSWFPDDAHILASVHPLTKHTCICRCRCRNVYIWTERDRCYSGMRDLWNDWCSTLSLIYKVLATSLTAQEFIKADFK